MTDQPSPTQNECWWVSGLKPKPGGNPADVPPDYLYNRDGNFYLDPRNPYVWMVSKITPPPVIDRRVLPNGEVEEWERPRSIADDFVYNPEYDAYFPPDNPDTFDDEEESEPELENDLEENGRDLPIPSGHLEDHGLLGRSKTSKSRPKLRGPKKKPHPAQLDLFAGLGADDDPLPDQ